MQPPPSRTSSLALAAALSLGSTSTALAQGAPPAPPAAPAKAKPAAAPAKRGAPPAKPGAAPAKPGAPGAPGAPAAPAAGDDIGKLINDGLKASKAEKWDEASALLGRAYRQQPTWKLAGDLGRAEVGAQKFRDAAEHLSKALHDAPADLPDADRSALETLFAQAKGNVGTLKFKVHPKGAEVFVDGVSVGIAPIETPIFIDPATIQVEAKAEGMTGIRTSRTVAAGTEEVFDLVLHRSGHFEPPPMSPTSTAGIFQSVELGPFIGGMAASAVLLVLGTAFAITSDLKASSSHALEQPTATCGMTCEPQFNSLQTQKKNFAGAAMWSFIGSGAALLGTGAYVTVMVIQNPKQKQQDVRAGVTVAPGRAAASLTARW